MSVIQTEPITVTHDDHPAVPGSVAIEMYNGGDRVRRAAAAWLGGLVLATAAVAVPLAHFILVPLFFVGGSIAGVHFYKREQEARSADFTCPACNVLVQMKLESDQLPPVYVYCPKCDAGLKLARA